MKPNPQPEFLNPEAGQNTAAATARRRRKQTDNCQSAIRNLIRLLLPLPALASARQSQALQTDGTVVPSGNGASGQTDAAVVGGERFGLALIRNPATALALMNLGCNDTNFCFSSQGHVTRGHTFEFNDDLATTNRQFLESITGDGSLIPCRAPMTNSMRRFFRVRQP